MSNILRFQDKVVTNGEHGEIYNHADEVVLDDLIGGQLLIEELLAKAIYNYYLHTNYACVPNDDLLEFSRKRDLDGENFDVKHEMYR